MPDKIRVELEVSTNSLENGNCEITLTSPKLVGSLKLTCPEWMKEDVINSLGNSEGSLENILKRIPEFIKEFKET